MALSGVEGIGEVGGGILGWVSVCVVLGKEMKVFFVGVCVAGLGLEYSVDYNAGLDFGLCV